MDVGWQKQQILHYTPLEARYSRCPVSPGHPTKQAPPSWADPGKTVTLLGVLARWRTTWTEPTSEAGFTPRLSDRHQVAPKSSRDEVDWNHAVSACVLGKRQNQTVCGSLEKGPCPRLYTPGVETPHPSPTPPTPHLGM